MLLLILIIFIILIIIYKKIGGQNFKNIIKLSDWPRQKYQKYPKEKYLIPHLGQRKLLICEIEFLTKYTENIVYAGAGPGHHTVYLSKLFPQINFDLYDPREFNSELIKCPNVKIFREYFTDEIAESYKNKNIVFICDIRTSGENFEMEVLENLNQQKKWCEIMQPKMACLKFRFPFNSIKKMEYFDGEIYLQPWAGIDSAETRLWTNCKKYKEYDCTEYEEKMFYYNLNLRAGNYDVGQPEPFDFCADCAHEFKVWKDFKKKFKIKKSILELAQGYEQFFNIPPHGIKRDLTPEQRIIELREIIKKFYENYHKKENEDKGEQTKRI